MNPIVLIPARMAATRLPNKPLADIGGLPMIVRVLNQALKAQIGPVAVAAGDPEIVDAVRRVHEGDAVFSPRLAGFVLDAFSGQLPAASDPELDLLTPREQDVMRLIARGYTYRESAASLHLSVKTVETHVSAVLRKLQLSNRKELTTWAATRRLT